MKSEIKPFLSDETKKILQKELDQLTEPVTVIAVLSDTQNKPFSDFCRKLLDELSALTEKIKPVLAGPEDEIARRYGITRAPTVLIQPEKYSIRFTGAPAGEEARTFLIAVLMASTGQSILSDVSKRRLSGLKDPRSIKVFVSPACPFCPQQTLLAICAAIEQRELISVEIIEIYENKDLATEYNAFSVPQLFIDDHLVGTGVQPEEVFVEEVMTAAAIKTQEFTGEGEIEKDLVIVGAGPAGLTAAIYAERSGIDTVVIEKGNIGGQVAITPVVENYPGFSRIGGKTLMDMMAQQAVQYTDIHQGEEVLVVQKKDALFEISTNRARYKSRALLITSGAEPRKLQVPGEEEFQGKGVSYCAACDGYFFKDGRHVIVVGGGNTAATEALYLKNLGVDVTLVHRRDRLRAELFLQESIAENHIPIIWNTEVKEIKGEKAVSSVVLENVTDRTKRTLPVDGVFLAIGYIPSNAVAKSLGVETDEEGYVMVDKGYRTNIMGVYAAGDITGGLKQIVTAVGQGSVAATTIFEDLSSPYWKKKS